FSACVYFLLSKLLTTPAGKRKWLTLAAMLPLSGAMFIGRSRGSILAFLAGLIPMILAMRWKDRLKILAGVVAPCIAVMLFLFAFEEQRAAYQSFRRPDERGLEAFTDMGSKQSDPTGSFRLMMWGQAWRGFLESPVIGKGYGWRLPVYGALLSE